MNNNSLIKKGLFAVGVFAALVFLTFLFLFLSSLKKTPTTPEKKPSLRGDVTTSFIKSFSPPSNILLTAGKVQKFTIFLASPIDPNLLQIKAASSSPSDISNNISVPIKKNTNNNSIEFTTTQPLSPVTTYSITITYKGQLLLQQSYLTSSYTPTPIPTNNPTLSSFLPYETLNYSLEFNKEQNIYIMHFKYNPNSNTDMTTQFNEAKTQTNKFIQGKGIDPLTVIIKYSYK